MKIRIPDETKIVLENGEFTLDSTLVFDGGRVDYAIDGGLKVSVKSEKLGVSFIYLRWNTPIRKDVKVLGDA